MGDESKPAQCLLRNSTESDDLLMSPTDGETLFYHSPDSLSGDIGFEWDNENPLHPFRFLDLPLEIQLEVIDMLSEWHENRDQSASIYSLRHPLLDLRQ